MKTLNRLLLINWHYIVHEVLEFAPVTFLTGKNGSGKSTIVDALQVLILGETQGAFFNKAANNSVRTVKGYLRGEVAEDEVGEAVALRNGPFSSYIVGEFYDRPHRKTFCFGVVFDVASDGTYQHRFFKLDDALPDHHFIENDVPLNINGLTRWRNNRVEIYSTHSKYQDVFRGNMGNLHRKFYQLFRRAVPFSPMTDVARFISEFVCDVQHEVDIEDMRQNIHHYQDLEEDLLRVKSEIAALDEIRSANQGLERIAQRLAVYQYLTARAEVDQDQDRVAHVEGQITHLQAEQERLAAQLEELAGQQVELHSRRDRLVAQKTNSGVFIRQQALEHDRQLGEQQWRQLVYQSDTQSKILRRYRDAWWAAGQALSAIEDWSGLDEMDGASRAVSLVKEGWRKASEGLMTWPKSSALPHRLSEVGDGPIKSGLSRDQLQQAVQSWSAAHEDFSKAQHVLHGEMEAKTLDEADLTQRIANLQQGIKSWPANTLKLRAVLQNELKRLVGQPVNVDIFADVLEVRDDQWQNAIEGYLHTQRFNLLVAPEYFPQALSIYDRVKQGQHIFDVGLVDIGRIAEQNPAAQPGSLAEEIVTDNRYAELYAKYLLGRVIKCAQVGDLRQHRVAVTPDGMLYQGYVVRQMDPKRWESLFIGQRALDQSLQQAHTALERVQQWLAVWQPRNRQVGAWKATPVPAITEVETIGDIAQQIDDEAESVAARVRDAVRELSLLDLREVMEIGRRIQVLDEDLKRNGSQRDQVAAERGAGDNQLRHLLQVGRPEAQAQWETHQELLHSQYQPQFRQDIGEPRYQKELARLGSAERVRVNFGKELLKQSTQRDDAWNALITLREAYNLQFRAGLDVHAKSNHEYDTAWQRLISSQLPEYEEKIEAARLRAQQQFQEDFVAKLRNNIETARKQIDDLNDALKDIRWGSDRYRFQVVPNRHYQKFYDMIMDDLLLQGYSLFSQSFLDRHQDTVNELFRAIVTRDDNDANRQALLEQNLHQFTDYRTYLDFDLVVKDSEGRESRLSRVMAKKSGGETQTPFYISVLASFVQVYRINQAGYNNTLRLIVFDEAYSKMDQQRIRESIRIIRRLGLQAILAAPSDKVADISPLVDRTLLVARAHDVTKVFSPFEVEGAGQS